VAGGSTGFVLSEPALAAGPGNAITAVWQRRSGSNWVIETRTIASDGSLGTTHELASAPYPDSKLGSGLEVAVAPDGTATAVWTRRLGTDEDPREIVETRAIASNGTLGTTQTLAPESHGITGLQVGVEDTGIATVAWETINGSQTTLQARQIQAGGAVGTIQTLATGNEIFGDPEVGAHQLSVSPGGIATVVWFARIPTTFFYRTELRMVRFEPGPDTVVSSGPSGPTNDTSPAFSFASIGPATAFECRLDEAPSFQACSSPHAYAALDEGAHTFRVRAKDATYTDPSPAIRSFRVDTVAPDTAINAVKLVRRRHKATVRFSGSDAAPSGPPGAFECSLDRKRFSSCSSPTKFKKLKEGRHVVRVRALDAAGNPDPTPARKRFRI
jgi:hypothetical protein